MLSLNIGGMNQRWFPIPEKQKEIRKMKEIPDIKKVMKEWKEEEAFQVDSKAMTVYQW
jgi:hypothetical protein